MKTIVVMPVEGRHVIDPATRQPIPQDGLTVEENSFWLRRIADGDVTVAQPAPAKKK